jgi:RimJ/RimL family protein N-acetyltransferase
MFFFTLLLHLLPHSALSCIQSKIDNAMKKEINLEEVTFRTSNSNDALEHFRAIQESDKEVSKFIPWVQGMDTWTLDRHETYLKKMSADTSNVKNYLFFHNETLVGVGHLKPAIYKHSAEISYWVRNGFDGHGLGFFIAKTMSQKAYANFGYRHVIIQTDRNNVGSKKVAEKLGAYVALVTGYYTHQGELSNMITWILPAPIAKLGSRFSASYEFDPVAPNTMGVYRMDYDGKLANYMAADKGLERKKG